MDKRLGLESHMDRVIWALCDKAKREGVLSLEVSNVIVKFWIDNTRVNPNMKDVVRRQIVQKSWESHLAHLLLES